ncbi:zinc ABC transporter substrate-binding protein [Halorhodospira halochloris]|uniref:zinc ABC transporter substrate-binding protein n=1 Tax=Halorhodospira halochloris TaxID=1052 RepID=UPI001EE8CD4C|nr:zinc ABC transporter substrate-binding protein [Halorhodospira halochloris]MCG5548703.1 zinc ABC transporter substrate-binding protein [Halorhodospira halochloris]
MQLRKISLLIVLWLVGASAQASQEPQVVASIKPLHSLAAAVMADVGEPQLLLSAGDSPHTYSMRPSDARAVRGADLVLYVSDHLEAFLKPALEARGDQSGNMAAADMDGITLLDGRQGADRELSEHSNGHDHAHGHGHDHERDYHLWLDPHNAQVIARQLADRLAELDAANAQKYRHNAEQLSKRLKELDERINERLEGLKGKPYVVFHDAYQYFERRYGLQSVGVVTLTPEQQPGAGHLREIRRRMVEEDVVCVFVEPQFEPSIVRALTRGVEVGVGELDPIGAGLEPGPEAYFNLLEGLVESLRDCLE